MLTLNGTRPPACDLRRTDQSTPAHSREALKAQDSGATPQRPSRKRQRAGPAAASPSQDGPTPAAAISPAKAAREEMRRLADLASTPEARAMCRFYNSSQGCKKTSCTYVHKCIVCGAAHPAVKHHRL